MIWTVNKNQPFLSLSDSIHADNLSDLFQIWSSWVIDRKVFGNLIFFFTTRYILVLSIQWLYRYEHEIKLALLVLLPRYWMHHCFHYEPRLSSAPLMVNILHLYSYTNSFIQIMSYIHYELVRKDLCWIYICLLLLFNDMVWILLFFVPYSKTS